MIKEDSMELLYNFRGICTAVLQKDLARAKLLFANQAEGVFEAYGSREDIQLMRIFLNSMNRSIYNYILYALELSLHQCCYNNMKAMHSCMGPEDFYAAGESIIQAYCACFQCAVPRNIHVEKARAFIEANLDRNINLNDVCEHIYVSRCYLCQLFKASLKCTFSEYLTQCRIAKAKGLLLATDLSNQQIAEQCGFSSPSYFSTVFKRQVGKPPLRFRLDYSGPQAAETAGGA